MTESRTFLDHVFTTIALAAVIALGLSAGAMLTEAVVFVSYWRELPASDFLSWFGENDALLVDFFGRLQVTSTIITAAAAEIFGFRRRAGGGLLGVSAALAGAVLVAYFLYFRDANANFAAGTVALDHVPAELTRWASWQWIRTALGVGAFVAALLAVRRRNV